MLQQPPFRIKDKLTSVLWITLFWLFLALYQYGDRYSTLSNFGSIDETYRHWPFIRNLLFTVTLGGIVVGTGLVFLWEKWLRKLSYARALTYIVIFYSVFFFSITGLAIFTFAPNDPSIIERETMFLTAVSTLFNINILPTYLFWLFICLLTILFLLVRDNFGSKTFTAFMLGKYFRPKREERVFMFMDLKSSTSIAEKLGEERYFQFLNDTFKLSTPAILASGGEIYQYVGDEMTVSWTTKAGFKKANCLRCFFEVKRALEAQREYFAKDYGVIPEFKAGLHYGHVVAGEIGIVKRAIVYSGDVLNTTARIQSLCKEINMEVVLSKKLSDRLDLGQLNKLLKPLGKINLRGKMENTELVTLADPKTSD